MDTLWEQFWQADSGEVRYLRCVMTEDRMSFEIHNPDTGSMEGIFERYQSAVEWLSGQAFELDTISKKDGRRLTPRQKKQLAYAHERRTVGTGESASRRTQRELPKLRRRQLRQRMKAFLRRELTTLHRDVSDQSFRSFRAEDIPSWGKTLTLGDALVEKKRRKETGKKTTRPRHNFPTTFTSRRRENDLPDWLLQDDTRD